MRTQKKCTRSSRFRITTIAIAVASSFAMTPAWAADTAVGSGTGVAYGTGSDAPKAENVAVGKGASISYSNGDSAATGDIVVGNGANINNYASQGAVLPLVRMQKLRIWPVVLKHHLLWVRLPTLVASFPVFVSLQIQQK